MNDTGHWVCRLVSQGTVSRHVYVKSQWDGAVLGESAPTGSKTMADLTREEAASLLRSLEEYPGLWP